MRVGSDGRSVRRKTQPAERVARAAREIKAWEMRLTDKQRNSVKGRPHYYSQRKEEYAHVKFDLDVGTPPLPHLKPSPSLSP